LSPRESKVAELARAFPWPSPGPESGAADVTWTGRGFEVAGKADPILSFEVDHSGWSDDLTVMHEGTSNGDHPVDVASRERALEELRRAAFGAKPGVLLEVGCSSGYFLRDARRAFPDALVIGSDYVAGPLRSLAKRDPTQPLMNFDLTRCPLPDASLDAVVALDVLEHIKDDRAAVREMWRTLKPGGVAVIELPAGPWLYDVYDKVLMHERRYAMRDAQRLFENAGFVVDRPSHLGFFVFPAFAAVKLRNKRYLTLSAAEQRAVVERNIVSTKSSWAMSAAMRLETWGARYAKYPFGIRCVFSAVKRAA